MIIRTEQIKQVRHLIESHPVVGIIGARQVGKTTLARQAAEQTAGGAAFFDLENPEDLARLSDPMLALKGLKGLAVIDEIQRLPDLFTVLRVLVDRSDTIARFLILGSASPDLLRQSSESLAGRIIYHSKRPRFTWPTAACCMNLIPPSFPSDDKLFGEPRHRQH